MNAGRNRADMMPENISIAGSEDWLFRLNKTIAKLGRAEFEDSLFDLVNAVVRVDHCAVFINNQDGTTAHLFTKSKLDDDICRSLAKAYTERFHIRDPKVGALGAGPEKPGDTRMTLLPQTPDADYDAGYKALFSITHIAVFKILAVEFPIDCERKRLGWLIFC
ncbi:MAG: hypothetical protein COB49_13150, partial [Alphaproteobacteria bacterium]